MTGYGRHEEIGEESTVSAEIRSVNNRYLDINVNTPPALSPLEPKVRQFLSSQIERGRVDVFLRARGVGERTAVVLDRENLRAYLSALEELRAESGIEEAPSLESLLRLEGVLRMERTADLDTLWQALLPVVERAFTQFEDARVTEGNATKRDILAQLDRVERAVKLISGFAPSLEDRIKTQLRERFREVLGDSVDENRVYAETAVLLVKYSINEEISRLSAHLASARELIAADGAVGKRLDFLCQELGREINTIGSKSIITEVNQAVIDAKDALENVREQLRNVE